MDNLRYGQELILDLETCDTRTFHRKAIKHFMRTLCDKIDMERGPLHFWDDHWTPWFWKETEPHLKGTTAIQFIRTSNITLHALDLQKAVRLNVFSCKPFVESLVSSYTAEFFSGKIVNQQLIERY